MREGDDEQRKGEVMEEGAEYRIQEEAKREEKEGWMEG